MRNDKETNRRNFIRGSAVTLAGAFCFSVGLKDVLALAKTSGKPILTQENLNQLFAEKYKAKQLKALAKEISENIVDWLKREFSLTQIQIRAIESIPNSHWTEVKKVLTVVQEKGTTLKVQITQTDDGNSLTTQSVTPVFKCKAKAKVSAEGEFAGTTIKAEASAETT